MRNVKKTVLKSSCNCGKSQIILEFDFPLEQKYTDFFNTNGFNINNTYFNKGILYLEDENLVAIGPFGSNRLQIKCKNSACELNVDKLENIIKSMT